MEKCIIAGLLFFSNRVSSTSLLIRKNTIDCTMAAISKVTSEWSMALRAPASMYAKNRAAGITADGLFLAIRATASPFHPMPAENSFMLAK